MIKLKTETYKKFQIDIFVDERGRFKAKTSGIGCSHDDGDINGFHATMDEALKAMKNGIDAFIAKAPKDWDELAEAITESLVWTGYEDCHVDSDALKVLVENFLRFRNGAL